MAVAEEMTLAVGVSLTTATGSIDVGDNDITGEGE